MIPSDSAREWTLPDALDVARGDVIALVGAGGKTATLFRLAHDLALRNWRVVVSVTTHLGRDQSTLAPHHIIWADFKGAGFVLRSALDLSPIVLVTAPPVEGGRRWGGVRPEWVAEAAQVTGVDAVLVEADGARGLSLKAPASHEPVVPPCTTLLVPVAAVDAVGRPVAQVAHRPEQVTRLTGLGPADPVTPDAVATVLAHPDGGLKGLPAGARVRVMVNKAEGAAAIQVARQIADHVLTTGGPAAECIEAVILGAVGTDRPVREVHRRVAPVVLAAGQSLRMAGDLPKLLLPWGGMPVIRRVVETAASCPGLVGPPSVVVGAHAEEIIRALRGTGANIVHNPNYAAGEMLSSLQAAVRRLPDGVSACLVLLGDQPWLSCEVVTAVLSGYARGPAGLVAPSHEGRRGHPVLIDRRYWPQLLTLPHGAAPRDLLGRYREETLSVPVGTDAILRDMDTWDDYQRALETWEQRRR